MTNNSNASSLRRWFWPLIGILAVILLYSFFRQTPVKVRVATVQRGPIRSVVSTNGKVEPVQNFEAHAPQPTTVTRILIKEGDHVHKGQLLLQLEDADARSEAAKAQAQVKAAQADEATVRNKGTQEEVLTLNAQLEKAQSAIDVLQRNLDALKRLQQQGAASAGEVRAAQDKLQSAQADLTLLQQKRSNRYSQPEVAKIQAQGEQAQAAYHAAESSVTKSHVRAPFDGVVYSIPVKQGAFVQAGELLLQEADLSHILVRAFVDEPDVGRLQAGQRVEVTWDALPGRMWNGAVTTVPAAVKPHGSRNVGETTCVIDNHDFRLLPNINVGVTIVVAEHDNVLTLQRDALRTDDSKPYVFQVVDDHLKQQPVQVALQNLTRVELAEGLSEGAKVALPAEDKPLVDGALVKIVP